MWNQRPRARPLGLQHLLMIAAGVLAALLVGRSLNWGLGPAKQPNILFLVVDALRARNLGCFGYTRDTSPAIDALARRGVRFTNATSPANYTKAAVPSIFTGVFPSAHGIFGENDRLSDRFTTLAEWLKKQGYATAAFMPNPSLNRKFNFTQGFDVYRDDVLNGPSTVPYERWETARKMNRWALEWLDQIGARKFFLYIHYRDVHGPYVPPPPYDTRYWDDKNALEGRPLHQLTADETRRRPGYLSLRNDHGALEYYVAQYDGEIRYTDDQLALFMRELEKRRLLDNTLIVITADHGESFLEHDAWNHGNELYEEELHVPLILVLPGRVKPNRTVTAAVQTLDLYPSIVELVGATTKSPQQGRSLWSLIDSDQPAPERVIYAQGSHHRLAARQGQWKTIRFPKGDWKLFDLERDARETVDRTAEAPDVMARLRQQAEDFEQHTHAIAKAFAPTRQVPDATTLEQLRALGYLSE